MNLYRQREVVGQKQIGLGREGRRVRVTHVEVGGCPVYLRSRARHAIGKVSVCNNEPWEKPSGARVPQAALSAPGRSGLPRNCLRQGAAIRDAKRLPGQSRPASFVLDPSSVGSHALHTAGQVPS